MILIALWLPWQRAAATAPLLKECKTRWKQLKSYFNSLMFADKHWSTLFSNELLSWTAEWKVSFLLFPPSLLQVQRVGGDLRHPGARSGRLVHRAELSAVPGLEQTTAATSSSFCSQRVSFPPSPDRTPSSSSWRLSSSCAASWRRGRGASRPAEPPTSAASSLQGSEQEVTLTWMNRTCASFLNDRTVCVHNSCHSDTVVGG